MDSDEFQKKTEEQFLFYTFKIKYNSTEENKAIHAEFQEYAKRETDNSYIMALKKLLDSSKTDWKYETLYNEIQSLNERLADAIAKLDSAEKKSPVVKTFGSTE